MIEINVDDRLKVAFLEMHDQVFKTGVIPGLKVQGKVRIDFILCEPGRLCLAGLVPVGEILYTLQLCPASCRSVLAGDECGRSFVILGCFRVSGKDLRQNEQKACGDDEACSDLQGASRVTG